MNHKFVQLTGTEPNGDFLDVLMRSTKVLYAKRTGRLIGLAFTDRQGELVVQFKSDAEAIKALGEFHKDLSKGKW